MYSRNYYSDEISKHAPPDNYNGTAFIEAPPEPQENAYPPEDTVVSGFPREEKPSSIFSGIPILSSLFGSDDGPRLENIGIEEILIIATAAFLFFSKDGDKECAIILLLLLFIN